MATGPRSALTARKREPVVHTKFHVTGKRAGMPACWGKNLAGEDCGSRVPPWSHWCLAHDPEREPERKAREAKRVAGIRQAANAKREKEAQEKIERGESPILRRGKRFDEFASSEYPLLLKSGQMERKEVAKLFKVSSALVSYWMNTLTHDAIIDRLQAGWCPTAESIRLLDDFEGFRAKFFRTDDGKPYLTKPFHLAWIQALLDSIENGTRQLILSPPRHGKTDLLMHFCVWLIVKNPNVKIIWVSKSLPLAKRTLDGIRDILVSHEELIEMYLPPGESFKPDRSSPYPWSSDQFTVGTRTIPGMKARTMTALGRGGTVLSLDANLIIVDDVVDFDSENSPSGRNATVGWMATSLESRKQDGTALFVIGSRVNPDDLYSHLLENQMWADHAIVEHAHDPGCLLEPTDHAAHWDCMLFPEINPYSWLMDQFSASEISGGRAIAEMVYQNNPTTFAGATFTQEMLKKARRDNLLIGLDGLEPNSMLIAGLDPAPVNYQASFLWAYTLEPWLLRMVDIDNTTQGGVKGALRIIMEWFEKYGLSEWVIEENAFQTAIRENERIQEYCSRNGIVLHGHQTYQNKHDPVYGVSGFSSMYDNGQILLPYGDPVAESKTNLYTRQTLRYDGTRKRGGSGDLIMASWFPMEIIRNRRGFRSEEVEYTDPGWEIDYGLDLDDMMELL